MRTHHDRTRTAQLAGLTLFATCPKRELEAISNCFTQTRVVAGETLMREGTVGRELVVIIDGAATVHRGGELVAVLGPGDVAGETALLAQCGRTATVVADTDLTVLVASLTEFREVMRQSPHTARALFAEAARRTGAVAAPLAA
jgi:CRP/FNR family transcriptional regulator, cyclic AMP receptor protein